jgi:hypothetical protein
VLLALFVLGLVLAFAVYPATPATPRRPGATARRCRRATSANEYVNGGLTNSYQDMLHQQQASHPLALVLGVIAIAIAALAIAPVLHALDPAKLRGTPRLKNRPRCHRPSLREKPMTHTKTRGPRSDHLARHRHPLHPRLRLRRRTTTLTERTYAQDTSSGPQTTPAGKPRQGSKA